MSDLENLSRDSQICFASIVAIEALTWQKKYMTFKSKDSVESCSGQFVAADKSAVRDLNRLREEAEELFANVGGRYKFTCNDTANRKYTHGQLCIVQEILEPGQFVSTTDFCSAHSSYINEALLFEITDSTNQGYRLKVAVAPAGERNVQDDMVIPSGWEMVTLSMQDSEPIIVGNRSQKGVRRQFRIVPFGTMTIHKALGQTCPMLVTRLSGDPKSDYHLW